MLLQLSNCFYIYYIEIKFRFGDDFFKKISYLIGYKLSIFNYRNLRFTFSARVKLYNSSSIKTYNNINYKTFNSHPRKQSRK